MKKLLFIILILFITSQQVYAMASNEVCIYNLKEKNMYLLDLDESAQKIDISDESILNVIPVTSLTNDNKQLFIEAEKNGVCDVVVKTQNRNYNFRFVTGPFFQENNTNLTQIDLPGILTGEKN